MLLFVKYYSPKQLQTTVVVWVILFLSISLKAQFAPPAGLEGTTAIKADSSVFVAWASHCVVERGFVNINETSLGYASFGTDSLAAGNSDNAVVSLGDGGNAILTFKTPIVNGSGADFAVFENSFLDDFLELAFVEVSSNGFHFIRFESTSNTQTDDQVETFDLLDATKINNLAGKYRGGYGTPFDLEELKDAPELDVNNIRAIRIIDVVGNIYEHATYDSYENPINDPWPTPFESSGFDLDAVGVIHDKEHTAIEKYTKIEYSIGPNPFSDFLKINNLEEGTEINIFGLNSKQLFNLKVDKDGSVLIMENNLPKGLLLLQIIADGNSITRKILHN